MDQIKLPRGFTIHLYAAGIANARSMALSPKGTLFVGSRRAGNVYAVQDTDGDHRADHNFLIAKGLRMPNGIAFYKGALIVAEVSRLLRFDGIEERLVAPPTPHVVYNGYPEDGAHGWKFIRFGPDGKLYVPVGAPCNVCESTDPRYASITRIDADGNNLEIFALGVRNTVGFDWHPDTGVMWFTDNGRDWMGDDMPPDELNRAPQKGLHFGFPYCHGGKYPDPVFDQGHRCETFTAPAINLGAHVAALGMRFYTGNMFPEHYRKQIFIAEHGSWNRRKKSGYRLSLVTLNGNRAVSHTAFATGWLQGQKSWGRPVDLLIMPDGALLVSDDVQGAIYRIQYKPSPPSQ